LETIERKAKVNNKITIITAPDDILQDGVRILFYGLEKAQELLVSSVIYNLKEYKPTVIYVGNGQNDSTWILDKKQKCSIIIFNAEARDQTMVGYLAAQPNSYYFGTLISLNVANENKINSKEQLTKIMEDQIT
jgi:hypothetical protein